VKQSVQTELFRRLPSVDETLKAVPELVAREGAAAVTDAARTVIARLRDEIAAGRLDESGIALALQGLPEAVDRQLRAALEHSLQPVINATGVVLHTNLGRAPLAASALERISEVAAGYSNLEFDMASGQRGKRDDHAGRLFSKILDADAGYATATVVVNNCAAAVLLALNTLAEGGEVVVSRGELVEIGGSFRVPDVMQKAGCTLREVGTTNRTRIADYENAVHDKTRLLLRVHRSNFSIVGFTEQPSLAELVALGRKRGVSVFEDLGSGALFDLASVGVEGESSVIDSLRAGVDLVAYSGDKLLGGPQAGMLSGRKEVIARVRSNPLFRALRVDKLTFAALEATLLAYVKRDLHAVPALRMMHLSASEVRERAEAVKTAVDRVASVALHLEIVDGESVIGGGAAPSANLPTYMLAVSSQSLSADALAAKLRTHRPPIVARVEDNRVLLDLRTVFPHQDSIVIAALTSLG
jgi:L-seryl-tRNA(Ser) seleniumtransferase